MKWRQRQRRDKYAQKKNGKNQQQQNLFDQ